MRQHLGTAENVAAGLRVLPETENAWAATQAAWRFYHNPRLSLPQLAEPLLAQARTAVATDCGDYALVMHDWSGLNYTGHSSKADRIALANPGELGYELHAALLVSDGEGAPLAPLYIGVRASKGVHSSRRAQLLPPRPHLDELSRTMGYGESLEVGKPLVHIIDREGDAVRQVRRWQRRDRLFIIRAQDVRLVQHAGREQRLTAVVASLGAVFRYSRVVEYKGQRAQQHVAETEVTLHRPAKVRRPHTHGTQRQYVPGPPLALRLVVSQVRNAQGQVLAQWLRWTNLPPAVDAATVALWYYWRWKIESFFKLLKSAGQHVEQWQQESAEAIAKRLVVAAQACVVVWALARATTLEAQTTRTVLIRLSGRLMKPHRPCTAPALLAGLWMLLAILDTLEHHTAAELRRIAACILPTYKGRPDG